MLTTVSHLAPDVKGKDIIIQTKGLKKAYSSERAILKGIDLTIRSGERVALIGSNGSGKSTLLKSLIGLHPISGGSVETLGQSFERAPSGKQRQALRRQMGFVFQKHCLVQRRSVLSNVVHGMLGEAGSWRAFCHHTAPTPWRDMALDSLDNVNLASFASSRADALSGGQQQRVAIARALVRGPKILIADEPAASLDPVAGRDVMSLFARLCQDAGITLLFTSHDMVHATEFADRIVALKAGNLFFDKPSSKVTQSDLAEVFDA